jgi:ubiquinol-cytochrome c reductase iron-sulfur subunit
MARSRQLSATTEEEGTRRDFLFVATGAVGAVTAGAAIWPLVDQMNPSQSVLALATIDIDVSGLSEGQQLTVKWRGKPVFVRYRTEAEIEAARSVDVSSLPDSVARNANAAGADATDANRTLGESGEYIVMMGVCTHLGCVPLGQQGDYNGWFCPCHGSHYDTAGRIRKGPAPQNLPIPELAFDGSTVTLIEEYKA